MELYREYKDGLFFLTFDSFNLYHSVDDRIAFKQMLNRFLKETDEILCYFRREEDLTDDEELLQLKQSIFTRFTLKGNEFKYLYQIDERRFDAIGKFKLEYDFANAIIEMWKYFYSFSFFAPINNLTFEEYEEYLEVNGFEDIDGKNHVYHQLANFICIKGLGGDYLTITSIQDVNI
ncbi:hypothetical protein [Pedobacter chitinilyticus]|uniref:Uncharacterized protein n=1 Tax=Pedobacter chitinilyticus TaxID=2233776 RepID=A0A443YJW1_9SPHI|nr:hypothetical protein [Pedobacter chitinilyticus]RWU04018.1 hypothetical protein DPV69_20290 [Pedobacter chitinilyticus]